MNLKTLRRTNMDVQHVSAGFVNKRKRPKSYKQKIKNLSRSFEKKRSKHGDEETVQYFLKVAERLHEKFDDDEEKSIYLTNVFQQVEGQALRLSCDKFVSITLEKLLQTASWEQRTIILKEFSKDFRKASSHSFASHVTETLLKLIHAAKISKKIGETKETNKNSEEAEAENYETDCHDYIECNYDYLEEWTIQLGQFILNNLEEFITDSYASHVVRVYLGTLIGMQIDDKTLNKNLRNVKPKQAIYDGINIFENSFKIKLSKKSRNLVKDFTNKIIAMKHLKSCMMDSRASAVLQTFLLLLHTYDEKLCYKLSQALLNMIPAGTTAEETHSFLDAVSHENISHLLEKIILISTPTQFENLHSTYFKSNLTAMAKHYIANFVLQRLILSCKTKEQFEEMFDELSSSFEEILNLGYYGILAAISEACVVHSARQNIFLQTLLSILHYVEMDSDSAVMIKILASLTSYKEISEEEMRKLEVNICYHGSLILQNILNFNKPIKVVNSLLSISPEGLKSLACSCFGSHVIDAFFKSKYIGEKSRKKFVLSLKSQFPVIACDKFGSRCFDCIWNSADLTQKCIIAEDLAPKEKLLNGNFFGRFVVSKCALFHFKNRKEEWKQLQTKDANKRKMIEELFDDSVTDSKKSKISKKKKRKDNWFSKE